LNKSQSRYFNTAVKMNDALIDLLSKKSFEYITVREICDRAGVNRSTFYLHYDNSRDLLSETTQRLIDDFLSYFSVDRESIVSHLATCDLNDLHFITEKYLNPYLSYIRDKRRIFTTALMHGNSFGFEKIYNRMYQYIFDPILTRFNYPPEDHNYVMRFYLNGINAIVTQWLKDDCKASIHDISRIIMICIYGK